MAPESLTSHHFEFLSTLLINNIKMRIVSPSKNDFTRAYVHELEAKFRLADAKVRRLQRRVKHLYRERECLKQDLQDAEDAVDENVQLRSELGEKEMEIHCLKHGQMDRNE